MNFYEQSAIGAKRRRQRVAVLQYEANFQVTLIERLEELIQATEELPPGVSTLDILFHIQVTVMAFAPRIPEHDRPEELPPREFWHNRTVFPTWTSKLTEIMNSVQETFSERRPEDTTVRSLTAELRRNIYVARSVIDKIETELVELREIQEIQDRFKNPILAFIARRDREHDIQPDADEGPVAGPEVNPAIARNRPRPLIDGLQFAGDLYSSSSSEVSVYDPSSDADESGNSDDDRYRREFLNMAEIMEQRRQARLHRHPLPRPQPLPLPAFEDDAGDDPDADGEDNPGPPRPTFREIIRQAEWDRGRRMIGKQPEASKMNPKPDHPLAVESRGGLYYPSYCGHRFSLFAHVALTLAQVKDDCYDECQRIISDNPKLIEATEAEEVILVEALGMIMKERSVVDIKQFVHHATLLRHIREAEGDEIPQLFQHMADLNSGIRRRFNNIANETYDSLLDIATRFKDELMMEFNDNAVPLPAKPWMEEGALIRGPPPGDLGLNMGIDLFMERDGIDLFMERNDIEDENNQEQQEDDAGEQQGEGSNGRQDKEEVDKDQDGEGADGSPSADKGKGKETKGKEKVAKGEGDEDREEEDKKAKGKANFIGEDADDEKEEDSGNEDDENEDGEESDEALIDPKRKGKAVERVDYKGKGKAVDLVDYKGKGKASNPSEDEDEGNEEDDEGDEEPAVGKIIGNFGELDLKGKGKAVVPSRPDEVPSTDSGPSSGNVIDRRPGRWAGQAVQISPRVPGTILQFPIPPCDSDDEATQWTWSFFQHVPFELQDAVATGSLHRINRELSLYGVRDAIDYVSLLQEVSSIGAAEPPILFFINSAC